MKKYISLLMSLGLMSLLCGCFDSREIDETAYIIAIGIDNGENDDFRYTFQFAAPLAINGKGGDGGEAPQNEDEEKNILDSNNPGVINTVVNASDFYAARNMLNNVLSKNIDMSHLKIIVFSDDIRKEDFTLHSQLFRRERQVRPHTVPAVTEASAEEFLRCVNPELEANTAKYYELMSLRSNNVYAPSVQLFEFADRLSEGGSTVLPLACVSQADSSSELRGMMVFKNSQPLGTMSTENALIYNILRRDIKHFTISMENKNKKGSVMSFDVDIPAAAKYTVRQNGGQCIITVKQALSPRYIGNGLPPGYSSETELMEDFNSEAEKRISDFFYITARDFGADIMETGNCVKKKTAVLQDWDIKKWHEIYKNAEFKCILEII